MTEEEQLLTVLFAVPSAGRMRQSGVGFHPALGLPPATVRSSSEQPQECPGLGSFYRILPCSGWTGARGGREDVPQLLGNYTALVCAPSQ